MVHPVPLCMTPLAELGTLPSGVTMELCGQRNCLSDPSILFRAGHSFGCRAL